MRKTAEMPNERRALDASVVPMRGALWRPSRANIRWQRSSPPCRARQSITRAWSAARNGSTRTPSVCMRCCFWPCVSTKRPAGWIAARESRWQSRAAEQESRPGRIARGRAWRAAGWPKAPVPRNTLPGVVGPFVIPGRLMSIEDRPAAERRFVPPGCRRRVRQVAPGRVRTGKACSGSPNRRRCSDPHPTDGPWCRPSVCVRETRIPPRGALS